MSVPVRCNLCRRDFPSTERFVEHYERRHFELELSGTHAREYDEHLQVEHMEDAK